MNSKHILFSLLLLTSCAPRQIATEPTQLEVRSIQSKEFPDVTEKMAMKAVMNVLQDQGFVVKNAVMDLGLLSAEKAIDIEDKGIAFMARMAAGPDARWNKHATIEASINIDEFGDMIRVRANFQQKKFDNFGCVTNVKTVNDSNYYQKFFADLSKALFIQSEKL